MATFGQFYELGPYFSGGNLAAGAKVYHYSAGTTTLLNAYSDRSKSTTVAQPYVLDSQGVGGFFGDGIYKLVVADAANTADPPTLVLYTFDNVNITDGSLSLVGKGANIASASTLVLGTDGDEFVVTGAVTINLISGTQTTVKLVFTSTPTLTYSGNLILAGGISYTVAANDVLVLANEGLSGGNYIWREVSRLTYVPDVGSPGTIPMSITAATNETKYVAALGKAIYGLTYDNGTDAVNDININIGGCMDATGAYWMQLSTALGKQSDVAWAVGGTTGTPAGGLDTGAVGNSDYYIWLIARTDTGVVDALFSLSSTAPTMPSNYTFKRLIGWMKRSGGTIVAFTTYELTGGGLELQWKDPTVDVNRAGTLGTSRVTDSVKVPQNFSTVATLAVVLGDNVQNGVWIGNPDHTDTGVSASAAELMNMWGVVAATVVAYQMRIRTSATGTIASRATTAGMDTYLIATQGFEWGRRN